MLQPSIIYHSIFVGLLTWLQFGHKPNQTIKTISINNFLWFLHKHIFFTHPLISFQRANIGLYLYLDSNFYKGYQVISQSACTVLNIHVQCFMIGFLCNLCITIIFWLLVFARYIMRSFFITLEFSEFFIKSRY